MRYIILGLGAQKAATTFIYKSLVNDPYYIEPLTKELHVHDTFYQGRRFKFKDNLIKKIVNDQTNKINYLHQLALMNEPVKYYKYFDLLIPNKPFYFSSDISPTYSLLSEQQLTDVKNKFRNKGIEVKVFFNMREPISRLKSVVEMYRKRRKSKIYNFYTECTKDKMILNLAKQAQVIERSNYIQIYKNITNVFDTNDYMINLYETMFYKNNLEKISDFLFHGRNKIIKNEVINATSSMYRFKKPYSYQTIQSLREEFAEQYDFAESLFPGSKNLWIKKSDSLAQN